MDALGVWCAVGEAGLSRKAIISPLANTKGIVSALCSCTPSLRARRQRYQWNACVHFQPAKKTFSSCSCCCKHTALYK